jgi:hypothetical protein
MGTSKSSREPGEWRASVSIFSGRPDPAWSLSPEQVRRLEDIWSRLEPPVDAPHAGPPPLGYRGAFVDDPQGRRWYAYGGRVALQRGTTVELRADPDREFERTIVESAPAEILPPNVRNAMVWK